MREHTGKGVKLGGGGAWLRCGGGQGRPAAALCNIVDFTACFQFVFDKTSAIKGAVPEKVEETIQKK